jgi:hypothetical protein
MKTTKETVVAEIKNQLDQLQIWFAGRPYGFRENATPQQLQQWTDREREEQYLLDRLEELEAING